MSRIAKQPIVLPAGVDINLQGPTIQVKGAQGTLARDIHRLVNVIATQTTDEDNIPGVATGAKILKFSPAKPGRQADAMAGTMRSLVNNMVIGVSQGFEKRLELVGVGYRVQAKGKILGLSLGFSHPIDYSLSEGVSVETPSNTTIVLKSIDKQRLGQAAAEVRSFRPPEPYKGKGIRYADEVVLRKETKKK